MADYNRERDYSHYAADDNWDKYDDRYGTEGPYRQNRGDYSRVHNMPDNDENRWEPGRYEGYGQEPGRGYGRGFDDWRGRGNVGYGGGSQNQFAQGNYDYGYPHDNRGREDWGYAYVNTGLNDDYNRSYYGSHRRHEDDDLTYSEQMSDRLRDYDRRNLYSQDRPGYREGDRALRDNTYTRAGAWARTEDEERRRMEGPHRGKGPKGYTRSAERIREDVSDRLADDDKLDASNIAVRMEGTEVVLEGTVESKRDKRRAEDLVESVPGVTNVQNHLVVGIPTTNAVIEAVAERNTSTYTDQLDTDKEKGKNTPNP
jgi:osmotically-inducible protein OsmY